MPKLKVDTREPINIQVAVGTERPETILAEIYGPLAIHRAYRAKFVGHKWSLTHRGSGVTICRTRSKDAAVRLIKPLLALPVDWDFGPFSPSQRPVPPPLEARRVLADVYALVRPVDVQYLREAPVHA